MAASPVEIEKFQIIKELQLLNTKTLFTSVALSIAPLAAWAGDSIQTDRPDFVESSNTVGMGVFQLETSVAWSRDKSAGIIVSELSTPTLLRYGISSNWEVRLETNGWMHQTTDDPATPPKSRESGFADYSLGVKWHQTDGDDKTGAPSVGWLFHLDMPGGADAFSTSKVRPSVRGVAEWELSDDFSLGVMGGVSYGANDAGGRYWAPILGVVLGKSFSDKLRGFIEFSGEEFRRKADGGSSLALDAGVAYLVTRDVQVDMVFSHGLNQYTPDYTLGFGLSLRFN